MAYWLRCCNRIFILAALSDLSTLHNSLPLLCHLERDHHVLGSVHSKLGFVVLSFTITPAVYVGACLLSDLSCFMLEVLHYLNVLLNFVNFVYDILELLARFFINTIINCSLQLLFAQVFTFELRDDFDLCLHVFQRLDLLGIELHLARVSTHKLEDIIEHEILKAIVGRDFHIHNEGSSLNVVINLFPIS